MKLFQIIVVAVAFIIGLVTVAESFEMKLMSTLNAAQVAAEGSK